MMAQIHSLKQIKLQLAGRQEMKWYAHHRVFQYDGIGSIYQFPCCILQKIQNLIYLIQYILILFDNHLMYCDVCSKISFI